jgi:hypothetical protein
MNALEEFENTSKEELIEEISRLRNVITGNKNRFMALQDKARALQTEIAKLKINVQYWYDKATNKPGDKIDKAFADIFGGLGGSGL